MSGPSALDRLRAEFSAELARVVTERDLQAIRDHFLGRKKGVLPALMKTVAAAPPETRPTPRPPHQRAEASDRNPNRRAPYRARGGPGLPPAASTSRCPVALSRSVTATP